MSIPTVRAVQRVFRQTGRAANHSCQLDAGMSDALPYDDARAIPIGILVTYLVLLLIKTVLKYAQILRTQGPQQANVAISQNTPATPDLSERDSSEDRFLRSNQSTNRETSKSVVRFNLNSGGDSAPSRGGIDQQSTDSTQTESGTKDKTRKSNLRSKIQSSNGGFAHGTWSYPNCGTSDDSRKLLESRQSGQDSQEPEPRSHTGDVQETSRYTNASDCTCMQTSNAVSTQNQATQIYRKTRDSGVHARWIDDPDETEEVLQKLVQSVVQQTQNHMKTQIQQAIQQTFSGLALGTPVRVHEYTEQFMKTNQSVVLTPTKRVEQDSSLGASSWDIEEEDWQNIQPQTSQPQPTSPVTSQNTANTTPKTIDQPVASQGGARKKTGFPTGVTRPSAVISGQPAGSEDFDIEDYVNRRILPTSSTLIATSPVFAAAVNLQRRRPVPPNADQSRAIEVVRRRPWDSRAFGRGTRSQEALRRRAEKKVAKRHPDYKNQ